ncbi:hypothetical protein VHUM_02835 [Vanrija humicola]|uniref:Uncharacterized protein n=1 Tax=Vanrija humicola TaxID=5417 RepID=A0A7D8ZLI3_VANHU|nr:hypothetical protein VHUM_02835 [Vanrija humicola]
MVKDVEAASAAQNKPLIFGIGHVLRYSPYNRAVKEVIDSGALGEIVNIQHMEPVGNQHFAHSFVRGNWSKEEETSFALMTKCCHDLDILSFYLSGLTPVQISSFGNIGLFKPSRKPKEAGDATRCLECPAEKDCVWSAKKIYLDPYLKTGRKGWAAVAVEGDEVNEETITDALNTGPYGVCVYEAGNDVVDHQVVNIEYEGGVTAMIQGTRGELRGDMKTFTVYDFLTRTSKTHTPREVAGAAHGGGDDGLSESFVQAVLSRDQSKLGVTPQDVLNSHLTVFAAEQARKEKRVVDFAAFKKAALA